MYVCPTGEVSANTVRRFWEFIRFAAAAAGHAGRPASGPAAPGSSRAARAAIARTWPPGVNSITIPRSGRGWSSGWARPPTAARLAVATSPVSAPAGTGCRGERRRRPRRQNS